MSSKTDQLEIVKIHGEKFLKISDSHHLRPFFMSIVSPYNHWMFISSNGGLTAGRQNAEYSLFPYYTDDKLTESSGITGSKTILKIHKSDKSNFWEPFSKRFADQYTIHRNIYKNIYGNKIVFEEINQDLDLRFAYKFSMSDTYGFVKEATIENLSTSEISFEIIDGLQNILPAAVNSDLQVASSNLVDAYKRNELDSESGLGIYALSAVPVDKAEPSEALKANVVWSLGVKNPIYLASSLQLEDFRNLKGVVQETDVKAEKGAYFVHQNLNLKPNQSASWKIIADVNFTHSKVFQLLADIKSNKQLNSKVEADIEEGTRKLINLNASADGLQYSTDELRDIRHYSNTMYNIMRGGIFDDNYRIERCDFKAYVRKANINIFKSFEAEIDSLGNAFTLQDLNAFADKHHNTDLIRLSLEYLPLKFSRRHGDPSRPWNKFSINTKDEEGNKILDYEGNWRDIFQNWEALSFSYPEFVENMIYKFLNASTFDGYNPYRVTKDGFDWEVIEPDDPWSYIGYWGDHQIIYLQKFLEHLDDLKPGRLIALFEQDIFVYANVPYRIKSYQDILSNPKDTIDFDADEDKSIRYKRDQIGADGALLHDANAKIIHVNFIEKILATTLAKVSNFIPEAGIWMNTQRPEWNDANNALVGNGVSMVTLYYLRRFLAFFDNIFKTVQTDKEYYLSEELHDVFVAVNHALHAHIPILKAAISDQNRRNLLDALATPASHYRTKIYKEGFSGKKLSVKAGDIASFISVTQKFVEHSILANKRTDHLYHAYNLMTINPDRSISVSYLEEMLEGQVGVLSSKFLSSQEALNLLDGLKKSKLFREDQYSYLLYPNKELKGYLQRNSIPEALVNSSKLFVNLLNDANTKILEKDVFGGYHFNSKFNNDKNLKLELNALRDTKYGPLVEEEFDNILSIYEEVFNHKAFTGRSGTFYGYEGLGSIYWHMVSKLQLAVFETCINAIKDRESDEIIGRLLEHYYEINEGIGVHKSPKLYGAFSTDPYSHTPFGKGAQQPGMTGQVKEDILSRLGELGVLITKGKLCFKPYLLRKSEFFDTPQTLRFVDVHHNPIEIHTDKNSMCFSICQVPVVYSTSDHHGIDVYFSSNTHQSIKGLELPEDISTSIFERRGDIDHLHIHIKESILK